ncbi:amino acid adenylation domain-containing protein [Streptomyces sp. NPDC047315]|uniref:amino acid adenylation domain-containing protein n=1 Tax=Streptomyces sp. NPDC047315 TaxID=3155142 RepID=UPI0033F95BF9
MKSRSRCDQEAVAIIGVALALPDADDLDALHHNLIAGRCSVGRPDKERAHFAGAPGGLDYLKMGYLNRIDLFDHRFFGLSQREAELMDPHQRMTAQLAHRAVENACYAPGELRGSRTAVVLSTPEPHYATLYTDSDPQQILGAHPAAAAARISYLFDFAGPSLTVETACSGSLTAIATAVEALRTGRSDLAIAGGLSLYPVLAAESSREPMIGLESPEGVCRPFDAAADGCTGGEGGGLVLLKRLDEALADGDHIHAVVRGICVNHNGFSATSMSAPSPRGQTEVILEAWREAGVAPVDYVEAHGSATRLGDVVEAEGLRRAFLTAGVSEPCGISGIKGNIGHLNHAAGVAGLFKVLAALRHGTRYPNPHFQSPNPLIDFTGPVHVDEVATGWTRAAGRTRRAGVSSFGLTGTNVHAVIEEPPAPVPLSAPAGPDVELVTLSAKSPSALEAYAQRVADFLDRTEHDLPTVTHALNHGRDDHPYRWAGTAHDTGELALCLRALRHGGGPEPMTAAPLVLLLSGDGDLGDAVWSRLRAAFPELADPDGATPGALLHARQCAVYELARSLGLTEARLVGSGVGNFAVRAIQSPSTAADARQKAADAAVVGQVDEAGLRRAVHSLAEEGAVVVELAAEGVLCREIARVAPELPVVRLFENPTRQGVLAALAELYEHGVDLDWSRYYAHGGMPRIEVPTYPFDVDEVSCWCRPPGSPLDIHLVGAAEPASPAASERPSRQDDIERTLVEIWSGVLKADDVDTDANYFELGGTSIAGITVLRQVQERHGVQLTFADLHEYPVLGELAGRIDALAAGGAEREDWTIPPIPRPGRLPLSMNQEQLWYLDRLHPGTPLYNIPIVLRYVGDLDFDAYRGAVRDVVDRHEVLRTRIGDENGRPYALDEVPEPHVTFLDLSALPDERRTAELAQAMEHEASEPFDLARGPLFRTAIIKTGAQEHLVQHTWHHIVFDGWTPAVFFGELSAYYTARRGGPAAQLPALPAQYADFAAWQGQWLQGQRMARGLDFWRTELSGLRPAELPLDHPRPATQSHRGGSVPFALDPDVAAQLRAFSVRENTTNFVTMLAVVDTVLALWAGQRDVVVGAATTGRFNPLTHGLIGYFNNLLPFRTRVDAGLSFRELVARCATTATGVLDHEEIPFAQIVAEADHRDPSRHPIFTVCYTHQNTTRASYDLLDLTMVSMEDDLPAVSGVAPGTSKFDLTFGLYDQDGVPMDGYLEYAVDLFEPATARHLVELFQRIAAAAMRNPDRPLEELLEDGDAAGLLTGVCRDVTQGRLVSRAFEAHAAQRPDEIAVVDRAGEHTYQTIEQQANRLAWRLVEHGVGPDSVVPVLAERGVELVVGWLAVHKAGGAFATIDLGVPEQRIRSILAGISSSATLVGTGAAGVLEDGHGPLVHISATGVDAQRDAEGDHDGPPPQRAGTAHLAYVSHTSGTTGRPLGCEVEHRSLINLLRWWGEEVELTTGDRMAQLSAPGFDLAVLEVMAALHHGTPLCFVDDVLQTPANLLGELAEHGVTVACLPTPLAELMLPDTPDVPGLALRSLTTGGDVLRARPPRDSALTLLNVYGPTECTVCATAGVVAEAGTAPGEAAAEQPLPDIGKPLPNTRVYLLDQRGRPVAAGQRGEVFIGGISVGRGYHDKPALTATRFVADPFADEPGARMYRTGDVARVRRDGTLAFAGRSDHQLELRGHRVEPAEVERSLLDHPQVREALVVGERQPSGAPLLVAHVAGEDLPPDDELLAWVARELPAYMVPGRVAHHDHLPKTSNGKLDRNGMRETQMPDDHSSTSGLTAVTTTGADPVDGAQREIERVLGEIWTDLLGIGTVSPGDNFFRIGGDSMLSVGVASRAAQLGLHLTPHDVLSHPTLRELAAVAVQDLGHPPQLVTTATTATTAPRVAAFTEPVPPSPWMQAMLSKSGDNLRDFIAPLALETVPGVRLEAVRAAFERLVEIQEPLRYRFRHNSLGWRVECAERENAPLVDARVLPPLDEEQLQSQLAADVDELAKDIDLSRGPALRVRFYDRGAERPGVILFVAHHFVFDALSPVPLVEDLNAALANRVTTIRRPAWREWTRHLRAMSTSDEIASELPYWRGIMSMGSQQAPLTENGPPGSPPSVVRRTVASRPASLLADSGPRGQQAAIAVAATAWSRWRGTPDAYLSTLGMGAAPNALWHGDRSTSLGWFTHLFPAFVTVPSGARATDVLNAAGAALSVPNDGIGYGVLRHLSPHTPEVAQLRDVPEPQVLVEHLANASNGLVRLGGDWVRLRSAVLFAPPQAVLDQVPVVVATQVIDGVLEIGVASRGTVADADMEVFADHLVEAFIELAAAEDTDGVG